MPRAPSPQVSDQMWRLPTPRSSYQLRSASVPLTPLMVVQLLEVLEAVDDMLGLGEAESPTDGGSYPHSPSLN